MDDAQRRDMWAGRIERCLSADMTIRAWCGLSKVSESNLYRWMARLRKEEPGRFPRRSSGTSNWIKVTAAGIADAKAIVPAGAGPSHTRPGGPRGIGHTGRLGRIRHSRGDEGGGLAVNPFTTPDAIYISRRPQDMRAGIQRLAAAVAADFGCDPMDGALYCFVSRDCEKVYFVA